MKPKDNNLSAIPNHQDKALSTGVKIKIPKELPVTIAKDKPLRKAVGSLLVLKAYYKDQGHIIRKDINKAADHCLISTKTLHRRLQLLISQDLVKDIDGILYLANWQSFHLILGLKETGYYYVKDTRRDIVDILEAYAMRAPVDSQRKAYNYWLKYTPGLNKELAEVTGRTSSAEAVLSTQLHCFLSEGKGYTEDQIDLLQMVGADFSVNTYYYNELFNYRGIGSMAYKKRRLQDQGLIRFTHRIYPLEGHTTRRSRETKLGDILHPTHGTGQKKAVLVMPDAIEFLNPNLPKSTMDKI